MDSQTFVLGIIGLFQALWLYLLNDLRSRVAHLERLHMAEKGARS
jgi:hypothetical protein